MHNDIVVNDTSASRSHARIEFRKGKFLLTDQSTNGTYIQEEGKQRILVKQFEIPLSGNGIITLGRKLDHCSSFAIHYQIKNNTCVSE